MSVWMVKELVSRPVSGRVSTLSLGGLEEPLNILFSNPPCEEKLRRLFPASLIVSLRKELLNHTGRGGDKRGEDGRKPDVGVEAGVDKLGCKFWINQR